MSNQFPLGAYIEAPNPRKGGAPFVGVVVACTPAKRGVRMLKAYIATQKVVMGFDSKNVTFLGPVAPVEGDVLVCRTVQLSLKTGYPVKN